ncbi:MAG TPA: TIGR03067 domain-containing protein [Urbifossiella sp.]|nr:TIGR03067 domain-containing protein [Urbifossiella sp.]
MTRRRLRRCLLVALPLLAVAGVVVWYAFLRGPSDDLGRMQGDWVLKGADGRDRVVVRIAGDRWTYHAGAEERGHSRIALNPGAAPKEIDLTALEPDGRPRTFTRGAVGVEMKEVGVYELRGDELRIAKAPAWHGGARPTSLTDSETPTQTLVRVR